MSREPAEVQEALATVSAALRPLKASKTVTWIIDRGGSRCGRLAHDLGAERACGVSHLSQRAHGGLSGQAGALDAREPGASPTAGAPASACGNDDGGAEG